MTQNINEIRISLDGNKESHDCHRRDNKSKSTFYETLYQSKELNGISDNITIRMTVTPLNITHLFDSIVFLINEGFRHISPQMDFFTFSWEDKDMQQYEKELIKIKTYVQKTKDQVIIENITDYEIIPKTKCDGGTGSYQIYSNGDIYPCSIVAGDDEFKCGSIFSDIDESWYDTLNSINQTQLADCEGCNFGKFCLAHKCKLFNYQINDDFGKPSKTICEWENIHYKLMKISV